MPPVFGGIGPLLPLEERQRKLLEYLAAKGKLKPPNPKPYLKETNRLLQGNGVPPCKVGPIVKQKENIPGKSARPRRGPTAAPQKGPTNPLSTSKAAAPQRPRTAPQKPLPPRPTTGKVPHPGSSRQPGTVGSTTPQRFPKCTGTARTRVVGKAEKQETVTVQRTHIPTAAEKASQNEALSSQAGKKQALPNCNAVDLVKATPLEDRTKPELARGVLTNSGHNERASASCALSTTVRNGPAPRSRGVVSRADGTGNTRRSSKVSVPPVPAWKAREPSVPPPRKAQVGPASKSLQSVTLHPESNAAKARPGVGIVRSGISTAGRTWSAIKTERANLTKVPERPAVAAHGPKNAIGLGHQTKPRVESSEDKSKEAITRRHTVGTAAATARGKPPNMPSSSTPATGRAPAPQRKAVTEVKRSLDTGAMSTEESRRRRLEEWLSSKGKSYKRPKMMLPPKKPTKKTPDLSFWAGIEEEDDLNCLADKIKEALSECLQLIEEGFPSEPVQAMLAKIPQADKFSKFWICKAKLLERLGTFDVVGLYEEAIRAGATPIEELRETIFSIMKNTTKKPKAVTFAPLPGQGTSSVTELDSEVARAYEEPGPLSHLEEMTDQVPRSPNILTRHWTGKQGSALKFQIAELPRVNVTAVVPDWKMLTPVRRSLRIERAVARYPETLREHDTVVASLNDLLDAEDSRFVYRKNEALPKEVDSKIKAL